MDLAQGNQSQMAGPGGPYGDGAGDTWLPQDWLCLLWSRGRVNVASSPAVQNSVRDCQPAGSKRASMWGCVPASRPPRDSCMRVLCLSTPRSWLSHTVIYLLRAHDSLGTTQGIWGVHMAAAWSRAGSLCCRGISAPARPVERARSGLQCTLYSSVLGPGVTYQCPEREALWHFQPLSRIVTITLRAEQPSAGVP